MSAGLVDEWVAKAEADYQMALVASRQRKTSLPEAVCYHAQQCVEKYLKAFLIAQGVPPPRTHGLEQLNDLCMQLDGTFALLSGDLGELTTYAVELRYPGVTATVEEARRTLGIMKQARQFIRTRLGLQPAL
jgi:HEPN domain-containing protein